MKTITVEVPEEQFQAAKERLETKSQPLITLTDEQVVTSLFFMGFDTLFEDD